MSSVAVEKEKIGHHFDIKYFHFLSKNITFDIPGSHLLLLPGTTELLK